MYLIPAAAILLIRRNVVLDNDGCWDAQKTSENIRRTGGWVFLLGQSYLPNEHMYAKKKLGWIILSSYNEDVRKTFSRQSWHLLCQPDNVLWNLNLKLFRTDGQKRNACCWSLCDVLLVECPIGSYISTEGQTVTVCGQQDWQRTGQRWNYVLFFEAVIMQ